MKFRSISCIIAPTPFGSFSEIPSGLRPLGILLNDPHGAGGLTANTPHFMILLITIFHSDGKLKFPYQ